MAICAIGDGGVVGAPVRLWSLGMDTSWIDYAERTYLQLSGQSPATAATRLTATVRRKEKH
ncbi:hypothetical protein OH799_08080 [Nocardia sp. NBC_00881]|uniref:hypothetical protein n=1 Tax=Nocardia sp. NBC_00881 TaxID=2975995 RepID=UPI0038635CF1|nr:hypothetical protein OH799_08080 [Nocardia sp. NBC_00881]